MDLTEINVSPKEFERVAADAYHGKSIRASLAYDPTSTLTLLSTTAAYDALKVSATGYSDYTQTLATGGYDAEDGQFEIGQTAGINQYVNAEFGPFPNGVTYNMVYYVIDSSAYIYGITFVGTQLLPPGTPKILFPFLIGIG